MEPDASSLPDWRDAAPYAPLLAADRSILAWEWLRRVPAYRAAARTPASVDRAGEAATWGLRRFENPDRGAPLARPVWAAEAYDAVLTADAAPAGQAPGLDLARFGGWVTSVPGGHGDHLLLSDGLRGIRIDLTGRSARREPVTLTISLVGPPFLPTQMLTLRRFEAICRTGRFARALHTPEPRVKRHILVLRTADALAAGAPQRDIAALLLNAAAAGSAWRDERPDLRLQAQRLVRDARRLTAGGYRALLGPG